MSTDLHPASLEELAEAVRSSRRVLAVGAGTKPRLAAVASPRISTRRLTGLVEYDPGEFTFTARAGTPLRDIQAALACEGQYLPFDPPFAATGATLGGTVAAGLSGPGRFRFGGVRDFILGVRFVDGAGRLLRLGGKVVKNAAGFDVPKFLVGSLGRFGVLGEVTFKVFPRPAATLTVRIRTNGWEDSLALLPRLATSRVEPDAIELLPDGRDCLVRLAGPEAALSALAADLLRGLEGEVLNHAEAAWQELLDWSWAHPAGTWIRIPTSPGNLPALLGIVRGIPDARIQVSAAGEVAYLSLPGAEAASQLSADLERTALHGLCLRGEGPLWLGAPQRPAVESAVKDALDPVQRFPGLFD